MNKKIVSLLAAVSLTVSAVPSVWGADYTALSENTEVSDTKTNDNVLYNAYKAGESALFSDAASFGKEWNMIALSRGEYTFLNGEYDDYYNAYYNSVVQQLNDNGGKLNADNDQPTDYARVIIALTSLGRDVTAVGEYNLLEKLSDMDYLSKQGLNSFVYALIALDTNDYTIPDGNVTREALINAVISSMAADSGWTFWGDVPDPDMTGMAIQALAPYYETNTDVKSAVDKGLKWLSDNQKESGGYDNYGENSYSAAQVVTALCALGIDPDTDERFIKNGNTILDAISAYAADGGFKGNLTDTTAIAGATQQCCYALASYYRIKQNKNSLYDMSDCWNVVINSYADGIINITAPEISADVIVTKDKNAKVIGKYLKAGKNEIQADKDCDTVYVWNSVTGLMPLCEKWAK